MPITGHLQELRQRIILSLAILIIFAGTAFYFSEILLGWLKTPLNTDLVFLSPAEAFWADLKVSLFIGFLVAFPAIVYQVWAYVSPGLLPGERALFLPFLSFGIFFFFSGIFFCYAVALPFAIQFLIDYGRDAGVTPLISVSSYVDFNIKILLAFGIIFELPMAMVILGRMGFLTAEILVQNRKYAILGAFVIAAIATPTPDIFNQLIMAGPLICLYEIGIITVRIFGKKKKTTTDQPEDDHASK